jgi:hypothetical protein
LPYQQAMLIVLGIRGIVMPLPSKNTDKDLRNNWHKAGIFPMVLGVIHD